jgi:hypothetical protein
MRNSIFKGESRLADRFQRLIQKIDYEDGCGLEEATRRARLEQPTLYKALQVV